MRIWDFSVGQTGKLQPKQLIIHHFTLDQVMQAFDTFGNAMKEHALNVIITNNSG
jgi:alcohol dehydrogenase